MKSYVIALCLLTTLIGCGRSAPEVETLPERRATVINDNGDKESIPVSDLYDSETGQPAAQSVLVIDRKTNRKIFIGVDQLLTEAQAHARYILSTESAEASSSLGDE